ncbi:uncharacterized protein [Battus philenor]|uniref:uncharacterized protein n=1 Tax=Battus philenor TaxID=42288 RepID=UPI0035D00992
MASLKVFFNTTRNHGNWTPVQRALLTKQKMVPQNVYVQYQDYLPKIVNNTLSHKRFERLPEIVERIQKLADYNIIGGKQLRGLLMLYAYEKLKKPDTLSEKQWEVSYKLAWAIEIMQAAILIADDVDDEAVTRRGKKCWHLLPDVGKLVVNDCGLLRSFLYETLRPNFSDLSQFTQIIELFNKAFLSTSIGQHLDSMITYIKNPHMFTEQNYRKVSIYKTSHYTFRFPLSLAMIYAQKGTKKSFEYINNIGDEIGLNLQMQNDYMDCFIDKDTMGKTSTDIAKGKLSWLAVQAIKLCNPAQHKEFKDCYGKEDPEFVQRVQNLYLDIKLPEICERIDKDRYDMILKQIKNLPDDSVPSSEIFLKALDLIYTKSQTIDYSK